MHLRIAVAIYVETMFVIILNTGLGSEVPGIQARRQAKQRIRRVRLTLSAKQCI